VVVVGGTVVVVVGGTVVVVDDDVVAGTVVEVEVVDVVDEQATIRSAAPTRTRLFIGSFRGPGRRWPDAV
jgi:hypothetical protein